ncbi:hypothetical protein [Phaeodactylibacter sp.]|uniref:hypothetical protein n=1 Tax=Phaeodactylibacter sp. TaxID=1940289 RepID=UPI0032EB3E44
MILYKPLNNLQLELLKRFHHIAQAPNRNICPESPTPQARLRAQNSAYRHPNRRVIFVGDCIDCGPDSPEVVHIVRALLTKGHASAFDTPYLLPRL